MVRVRSAVVLFLSIAAVLALATTASADVARSWTQVGDDVEAIDREGAFGRAIDVSADGTRMIVGEPHSDVNGFVSGQARVFDLVDGSWSQVGQTFDGDRWGDALGLSVAISGDGSRIVIGLVQGGNSARPGIARVFDLVGDTWIQTGGDLVGESEDDRFGETVAISTDGSRVAVAALWNDGSRGRTGGGHVRVYRLLDSSWMQVGGDIDGNGVLGVSLALSADGSRLVAGESGYSEFGIRRGRVRAFQLHNGAWVQIGQDILGEADDDSFGIAADISGDGWTIVTGAPFNDGAGDRSGHVRVYGLFNWTWVQIGPDIDGAHEGEWFGWDVSISHDGNRIAGGIRVTSRDNVGLARIYDLNEGTWVQVGNDILDGAASGTLIEEIALTPDGSHIALGATDLDELGVARVFSLVSPEPAMAVDPDPELPVVVDPDPPVVDPPDVVDTGPSPVVMCGGVEATIVGTPDDDILEGTDGPDVIAGLQGNDQIRGLGGDDIICGGVGDDTIYGGEGFDIMFGAQGDDIIFSANGNTGALRSDVRGMRAFGGAGDDSIYGSDRWDRMQGGPGVDRLFGYEGRDWMRGGAGPDDIDGGIGVDDLHGGNGNDLITLTNGDAVRGGAGALDECQVTGAPTRIISCELRN